MKPHETVLYIVCWIVLIIALWNLPISNYIIAMLAMAGIIVLEKK